MKNKLSIFDFDGTLFDTKDLNYTAYKHALNEYGFFLDYDYFCTECFGNHYLNFLPKIINEKKELLLEIHERKKAVYSQFLHLAKINIHLFNIIECIKSNYNTAIVTTASRKSCLELLEYFNKRELFDLIISQEDVKNPKPDPEGFIKAMSAFKVNPSETVIFEDSAVGIEAGMRSGGMLLVVGEALTMTVT